MRLICCLMTAGALALATPTAAQDLTDYDVFDRAYSIELKGLVLLNGFYSDHAVTNHDSPWLVSPRSPLATNPPGAASATVRNSRIILLGKASDVLGGEFDAELDLDFYGGAMDGSFGEPRPRIRRAVGTVRWANGWMTFGQERLLISPIDPSSLVMIGVPGFTGSGNLSAWMPQVRFGLEVGYTLRLGIEAAAVAPSYRHLTSADEPNPDRAERTRRPFVQGRLVTRWGNPDAEGELGLGGHYGWFYDDADSLLVTRAATVSSKFSLGQYIEIRGEAFYGDGLGMLGGGGIDQTLTPSGAPIRTKGGWAQLILKPRENVELGAAYGMDDPDNDLDPSQGREKNVSWATHLNVRVQPLLFGIEYRRIETTYSDNVFDLQTANFVNLSMGFEF